uniref:NAC domain-containing protein n=1 Tax=Lactuca sativa TaxID=4236 RepID=A0A9R1VQX6_LACSA|nr:hypothetical protein LSAT_V11C400191070 [Lactuca sativa]
MSISHLVLDSVPHTKNSSSTSFYAIPYHPGIIPDLDLYPYDPWDLDGTYFQFLSFFNISIEINNVKPWWKGKSGIITSCKRTQNRITTNGYCKAWDCDEQIISSSSSKRVGVKKYYVFHIGEAPDGVKTNWIMQEFRLSDGSNSSIAIVAVAVVNQKEKATPK